MIDQEKEKLIRLFILDTLISHSGKLLLPDFIGQLTNEIQGRVVDAMANTKTPTLSALSHDTIGN